MRILHVISSIDPKGGGPMEGVRQLSIAAREKDHLIHVASLDSPSAPYLEDFPAKVYALGPANFKYAYSKQLIPWLHQNSQSYDVIVVNGIWQYHSFAVWRVTRNSKTPYVVFTHGMLDPWFKRTYPLKHYKKWLYWPWAEYRVIRDAAGIMFTCEEERRLARESFWLYSARERVINYGTAVPPGGDDQQRHTFSAKYPTLEAKRLVTFMGRIHPKKGCDLVLQAFAAELARDPAWHLVIAGPDQTGWQSTLISLAEKLGISESVTWTGMVTGDLKYGLLKSSEVLFLPSHQENFGIVVAEALACNLPVLISDKVNIWREISDDGAGLVEGDTLEGAARLLKKWNSLDPNSRDAFRRAARRSFEHRFEVKQASASLLSALAEIPAAKASPSTIEPSLRH